MAEKSGNSRAASPENQPGSSDGNANPAITSAGVPLRVGSFDIDDLIVMHLQTCQQCYSATRVLKPRGIGQKTRLCDDYLHLQIMRANYEGKTNNIVHWTEAGDEAPTGRPLE